MNEALIGQVVEILNEVITNGEITTEQIEEDLSALGLDSITFIRVIVNLEETFDIEIPDEYLMLAEMNTVAKIAKVVDSVIGQNSVEADEERV